MRQSWAGRTGRAREGSQAAGGLTLARAPGLARGPVDVRRPVGVESPADTENGPTADADGPFFMPGGEGLGLGGR